MKHLLFLLLGISLVIGGVILKITGKNLYEVFFILGVAIEIYTAYLILKNVNADSSFPPRCSIPKNTAA